MHEDFVPMGLLAERKPPTDIEYGRGDAATNVDRGLVECRQNVRLARRVQAYLLDLAGAVLAA